MGRAPPRWKAAIRATGVGSAALIGTAVLWGSNHVVARGSTETVPFAAFVFWRWAASLPLLGCVALPALRREAGFIRRHLAELALLGAVGVGLFSVLLIGAAYNRLAVEVSIINTITPAWVALIILATTHRAVPVWTAVGLVLAFTGAVLILTRGHTLALLEIEARIGNFYALAASILFA